MKNIRYMQRALELATQAQSQDEVPIGCIIVNPDNDEIIAETYNLSQHVEDATAHAEITAIRSACQKLGQNRLRGLDMYVTLEPCTMCAAAISFARIYILVPQTQKAEPLSAVCVFLSNLLVIIAPMFILVYWKKNALKFLKIFSNKSANNNFRTTTFLIYH